MKIAKHTVVSLNYTLKNSEGTVLDTSEGREPLVYLHGVGALIPGLEKELLGMEEGDATDTKIEAKDGYGPRQDELMRLVPKSGFQGDEELQVGMQVQVQMENNQAIAVVAKVDQENVTLDFNHPLAGVDLYFSVEVVNVREATQTEIEHKHVHGPGGHDH